MFNVWHSTWEFLQNIYTYWQLKNNTWLLLEFEMVFSKIIGIEKIRCILEVYNLSLLVVMEYSLWLLVSKKWSDYFAECGLSTGIATRSLEFLPEALNVFFSLSIRKHAHYSELSLHASIQQIKDSGICGLCFSWGWWEPLEIITPGNQLVLFPWQPHHQAVHYPCYHQSHYGPWIQSIICSYCEMWAVATSSCLICNILLLLNFRKPDKKYLGLMPFIRGSF